MQHVTNHITKTSTTGIRFLIAPIPDLRDQSHCKLLFVRMTLARYNQAHSNERSGGMRKERRKKSVRKHQRGIVLHPGGYHKQNSEN